MSSAQLLGAEALPYLGIDAMAIGDAEQPLRAAHDGADPLVHRIGELKARCKSRIRTRYAPHILRVLSVE